QIIQIAIEFASNFQIVVYSRFIVTAGVARPVILNNTTGGSFVILVIDPKLKFPLMITGRHLMPARGEYGCTADGKITRVGAHLITETHVAVSEALATLPEVNQHTACITFGEYLQVKTCVMRQTYCAQAITP